MDDMDFLGGKISGGLSKSAALNEMSGGESLGLGMDLGMDSGTGMGKGLGLPALKKPGSKMRHAGKSVNKSKKVSLPKVPGLPKIKGSGKKVKAGSSGVKLPKIGKVKLPKL